MPASAFGIETARILQALWRTLNSEYCSCESVLKRRRPGHLNKLRLSAAIETDYKLTEIHRTEFVCCIGC